MDFCAIRYKHIGNRYYALYEMTKDMWCIVVYADDEEDILFSCVELDFRTALWKYNQIKDGKLFLDLY